MTRATYVVHAVRSGRWWVLTVPQAPGAFSQVRRLNRAEEHAREAVAFVLGVPPDSFDIEIRPELPDDVGSTVEEARHATRAADLAQREAARKSREAVRQMTELGLTGSEAAAVMRVSPQRISQLLRGPRSRPAE